MPIGAPVAIEPRGSVGGSRGDSHAHVHVHVPRADSRLLSHVAFEATDDLDLALQSLHARLKPLLASDSEGDVHSQLQEMVSEGAQQHADVVNGLLYAILTESHKTGPPPSASSHTVPAAAVRLFGILCSVTRDHHASLLATLQRLASDTWGKLQDHVRSQVIWILRQLVQQAVQEAETLFLCLFRQVSGGDLSVGNVWLARQLLDVLRTNTQWLYTLPNLLALSLYTFLRLLPDHAVSKAPTVVELKQQEVAFCTQLIRERFQDCLVIGRDLVRLLQDVALIPDFEPIWRDLVHRPETMGAPGFSDLAQLYVVRTPTRFITSRVTPEMESQLRFLLAHVRMGHQRRYQTWFATRFLAAPESESLVADLIRFVCCSVHPTNQVLQSDVVPRWAIVGWLLKCCRSCHMEANAKLALFYDWLFFMPKTDNIMNIEPAMLCMVHSLPKYAIMTNSLLEFLFLLLDHYDAAHRDLILRGISASIDILVGKGVVPSLEPLATSGFIPTKLRERLQTLFPAHCRLDASPHRYLPPSPLHDPHHAERAAAAVIPGGGGGAGGRGGQARGSGALVKSPSPSPPHLAAERDSMGNIVGGGAGKRAVEEQRGKEGQVADMGEVGAGVSGSRPVGGSSAAAAAAAARREPIDASGSIAGAGAGEDAEKGEASAAGEDQAGGKGPGGAEKRGESAEGAEMELGEHGGGEGEVAEGGSGKGDRKRKREEREEGEEEAEEGGDVEAGEVEGGDVVEEEGKGEQSEELEGMDEEMKAVEGIVKSMEEAAAAGDGAKVIEGFKAFLEALRGEYSGIESGGRKPQREAEGKAPGNGHGEFKGGQETENEGRGGMGGVGGTGKRAREGRHAVKGEQRDEEDAGLDEERSDRSVDSDVTTERGTTEGETASDACEDGRKEEEATAAAAEAAAAAGEGAEGAAEAARSDSSSSRRGVKGFRSKRARVAASVDKAAAGASTAVAAGSGAESLPEASLEGLNSSAEDATAKVARLSAVFLAGTPKAFEAERPVKSDTIRFPRFRERRLGRKEWALISTRVSQCLSKVGSALFPSLASLSPSRLNELLLPLPRLAATVGTLEGASRDCVPGNDAFGKEAATGKDASGSGASEDGTSGNGVSAGAAAVKAKLGTPYPFEGAALSRWTSTLMVLHEYVLQNELWQREWRAGGGGEDGEETEGEQREEAMVSTGGEEDQGSRKGEEGGEEEQEGEVSDKKKGEYGGGDLNSLLPVEELLISWHDMGKPVTAWLLCVGAAAAEKEQLSEADALAAAARVTNESGREESGGQRGGSREKPAAECVGQQGKKEGLGNGNKGVVAEVFFGLYERLVGLCWGRDEEGSNEEEDVREEGRGEGRDGGRGEGSGMEKDGGGDGGTGRKGGLMGKEKKGGIGAGKQASSAGAAGLSGGPGAAEGKGAALEEKAEEGAGEDKLPPPRCNGVLYALAAPHPLSLHHHHHHHPHHHHHHHYRSHITLPNHQHLLASAVHMDLQRWILLDGSNLLFQRVSDQALRLLPHATSGHPPLLHLLLSAADPPAIAALQSALVLGELSLFRKRNPFIPRASEVSAGGRNKHQRRQQVFVSLVGDSWSWDGQEQQWLWQLAAAEAVGWGNTSEGLVGVESEEYVDNEQRQKKQQQGGEELSIALLLLQASATAAASSNSSADTSNIPTSKSAAPPASHNAWEGPSCEALAGLEMLLLQATPSAPLLSTLLSLPADRFGRLPCSVLRAWALKDPHGLCSLLRDSGMEKRVGAQQKDSTKGGKLTQEGLLGWCSGNSRSVTALRCNLLSLLGALDRIVQTDCRKGKGKGAYKELSDCITDLLSG